MNDENPAPAHVPPAGTGQLVLYQTEDGRTRVAVRLIQQSVWLTLNQIADLFQRDKSVISMHIKNVFETGELDRQRTVAKFATVQTEGARSVAREIEFYRLEVILAVGYRVKSPRGTQFRQWATAQLEQYLVKGFAMDDDASRRPAAGIISRNCWPAFATSVRRSAFSGERCSTSMLPVWTTIRGRRRRRNSSRWFRTRCAMRGAWLYRRRSDRPAR